MTTMFLFEHIETEQLFATVDKEMYNDMVMQFSGEPLYEGEYDTYEDAEADGYGEQWIQLEKALRNGMTGIENGIYHICENLVNNTYKH